MLGRHRLRALLRIALDQSPRRLNSQHEAVERSRANLAEALTRGDLSQLVQVAGLDGEPVNLRRLVVDMIDEYARHNGQADLIRESVDGRVGEDPPRRLADRVRDRVEQDGSRRPRERSRRSRRAVPRSCTRDLYGDLVQQRLKGR
ncbi:MAG: DUF664 domain-containing protein [Nocardioides sp.]